VTELVEDLQKHDRVTVTEPHAFGQPVEVLGVVVGDGVGQLDFEGEGSASSLTRPDNPSGTPLGASSPTRRWRALYGNRRASP